MGGWLVPLALANALSAHDDVLEMRTFVNMKGGPREAHTMSVLVKVLRGTRHNV